MPKATPLLQNSYYQESASMNVGDILLMVLYLVLILVGVFYATRLFARLGQRGLPIGGKGSKTRIGSQITLIDRLMLDKDKSIVLLEQGDKWYLVGVSNGAFTLIKEMEPAPEQEDGQPPAIGKTFKDVLSSWKDRGVK